MALTDDKIKYILDNVNNVNVTKLTQLVVSGDISVDSLRRAGISPERLSYIEKNVGNMPNANEQQQWRDLQHSLITPGRRSLAAIDAYIAAWKDMLPPGNHVEEARQARAAMVEEIRDAESERDNAQWIQGSPDDTVHLNRYLQDFPNGMHADEARRRLDAIEGWERLRHDFDIFSLGAYIRNNPSSPYLLQASTLYEQMRADELRKMADGPETYDVSTVSRFLDQMVFSRQELVDAGVATHEILDSVLNPDADVELPDITTAISHSWAACRPGFTDVYFFGVPSTGKTCVMMGLTRSEQAHINLACGGGEYAAALMQYVDASRTAPRTPGSFVTTLEASFVPDLNGARSEYYVNLIEMSGEEFAFGIAGNPRGVFDFESMGTGATRLLMNDNRKIFFLVIDPTMKSVSLKREVVDHYDEMTGVPVVRMEKAVVNQRIIMQKIVDIFSLPENAQIMSKVDAIHIIMTKADRLSPDRNERDNLAVDYFSRNYQGQILQTLVNLCAHYNINSTVSTPYHPRLYPFSLGRFSLGGMYEYESQDSNRLVKGICDSIAGVNPAW